MLYGASLHIVTALFTSSSNLKVKVRFEFKLDEVVHGQCKFSSASEGNITIRTLQNDATVMLGVYLTGLSFNLWW